MADNKTYRSPKGEFLYPRLVEPDFKFKADGEYSCKLVLDADAAAPLMQKLEAMAEERTEQAREELEERMQTAKGKAKVTAKEALENLKTHVPYEPEYDDDGEPTGRVIFNFKQSRKGQSRKTGKTWTNTVKVFDSKGRPITGKKLASLKCWSGTVGRLGYQITDFYTDQAGAGVSLRLQSAQIVHLVEGGSGNVFEEDDEGDFDADDVDESAADAEDDDLEDDDLDDEVPF